MKALMAVNAAFKALEVTHSLFPFVISTMYHPIKSEHNGTLILHKIIFVLGQLSAIGLAIYKCHSMGLLPNHASDWLDFVPAPERMQYLLNLEFS